MNAKVAIRQYKPQSKTYAGTLVVNFQIPVD